MKRALRPNLLAAIALVVAFAAGALAACASRDDRDPPPRVTQLAEPTDVIDEQLMVALAQAKNFHHKAKVYTSDGKTPEAIAAVRQILSLRFPAGAPEADDVRQDARALLAKLLASQGRIDEAMTVVDEGLASATRDSFFVANLHTVKGELHYARAKQLDASDPRAVAEKRAAIEELDRSIRINEALQKQLEQR